MSLDAEHQNILQVWVAFLGYAIGRHELMEERQRSAGELRASVMVELQALQAAQHLRADIDPAVEANTLLALMNCIGLDSLIQAQCLSPVMPNPVNKTPKWVRASTSSA